MTTTTPFLTVTKGDLNIAIDLSSLLGTSLPTPAPITPEPKAPTTKQTVRRTVQKATRQPKAAPKAKRQPKAAKGSDKPLYAEIRRLTTSGQHDQAIALAAAEGWDHVVKSIESHRAKHGAVAAQPEPKAPAKPKAAKPKAPAAPKPKAPIAPKAPKVPATKSDAKRAAKAAQAPKGNKPQAFPTTATSEADLVLHWAAAKAAGHTDVLKVAHQATATAFGIAASKGDAHGASLQMKRLKNLDNLLAA